MRWSHFRTNIYYESTFLTIMCLLDIERIDILIAAWIIDIVVIKIYYEWWKEWNNRYEIKKMDWRVQSMNLQQFFYKISMNYNEYCNLIKSDMILLRNNVLLVYKGLTKEEIELCKIEFFEKRIGNFKNWWNTYYIAYDFDTSISFEYYDSENDEQFFSWLFIRMAETGGDEKENVVNILERDLYELMKIHSIKDFILWNNMKLY